MVQDNLNTFISKLFSKILIIVILINSKLNRETLKVYKVLFQMHSSMFSTDVSEKFVFNEILMDTNHFLLIHTKLTEVIDTYM